MTAVDIHEAKGKPMTLPARSWSLILAPLLLAVFLSFHPPPEGDVMYDGLRDHVTAWTIVHLGLVAGACVLAFALRGLLRGMTGRAATVSRVALVPFVVCFVAWEATLGIGTGMLVDHANGLPAGPERDAVADAIQAFFTSPLTGDGSVIGMIGNMSWIVAVVAAGLAVRRNHGGVAAAILLCMATLFTMHAIVLGPIGLVCFAAAAVLVERKRARVPARADRVPAPSPDAIVIAGRS